MDTHKLIRSRYDDEDNLVSLGRERAITRIAENAFMKLYYDDPTLLPPRLCELLKYNKHREKAKARNYYFLTVNFPPLADVPVIKELFEKWKDQSYVSLIAYEWEEKDHVGNFSHPHVHCLVRKTDRPSHYINRVFNTFKEHLPHKECVDLRSIKEEDKEKVIKYIKKTTLEPIILDSE